MERDTEREKIKNHRLIACPGQRSGDYDIECELNPQLGGFGSRAAPPDNMSTNIKHVRKPWCADLPKDRCLFARPREADLRPRSTMCNVGWNTLRPTYIWSSCPAAKETDRKKRDYFSLPPVKSTWMRQLLRLAAAVAEVGLCRTRLLSRGTMPITVL